MMKKMAEVHIEPLTRIEGHLGIYARADLEAKKYVDAYSYCVMFRGFEIFLKNREPADAIWITQRICGVCPVPHATASVEAVDMAYGVTPPPLSVALRNFVDIGEELYDPLIGAMLLEGPDYSRPIMERFNPDWWEEAKITKAEHAAFHGFTKISDIMEALTPITGKLWLKAVEMQNWGKKMASIFGGKHPHVNTFIPGGIAVTPTMSALEQYVAILSKHIAFAKEFVLIFDDLLDFLARIGYEDAGARKSNLICYGIFEDPEAYDAKYENMTKWAEKRKITPGVVINGELVTTDLVEINLGIRQYVTHSYLEDWGTHDIKKDPLGNEIVREHPWNKETIPKPGPAKNWADKYSWDASIRWHDWKGRIDGKTHVVEAGPISRLWTTSLGRKVPESTGRSLRFTLPKVSVEGYRIFDEYELEWKVPSKPNTIERVRARPYFYAYTAYVAYHDVLKALELVKAGKLDVWTPYTRPKEGLGVGMTEAMRGALGHWLVMHNGVIHRYQIITPTSCNASPRDAEGRPGPYEEALIGTPVTEAIKSDLGGVDVVRVIRSFDPCIACSVHVYKGRRKVTAVDLDHHH
ncbi:MAG: nickel-dependent hydrogenase large subunit [Nitrososphaerales archaeon]